MLIGFMASPWCGGPGGPAASGGGLGCGALPGGQVSAPRIGRARPPGSPARQDVLPAARKAGSAGVARRKKARPRGGKRSLPGRISGPVAGPAARRRLTEAGKGDNRRPDARCRRPGNPSHQDKPQLKPGGAVTGMTARRPLPLPHQPRSWAPSKRRIRSPLRPAHGGRRGHARQVTESLLPGPPAAHGSA